MSRLLSGRGGGLTAVEESLSLPADELRAFLLHWNYKLLKLDCNLHIDDAGNRAANDFTFCGITQLYTFS